MSLVSEQCVSTGSGHRLRDAARVAADFLTEVIPSRRLSSDPDVQRARIERPIASQAWTDAALALVELELPQWQVRRLAYDAANGSVRSRGSANGPTGWTSRLKPITPISRAPS